MTEIQIEKRKKIILNYTELLEQDLFNLLVIFGMVFISLIIKLGKVIIKYLDIFFKFIFDKIFNDKKKNGTRKIRN